jgi:hypothetical protein
MAPMLDPFTPNLELIAAARPDLIVDAWGTDEIHASLSAIAPTVQIKVANETTWQEAQTHRRRCHRPGGSRRGRDHRDRVGARRRGGPARRP